MVKAGSKLKSSKRARKFIKDKAIVNFLLEHMKPAKINFSKIKIPSFLTFLESDADKNEETKFDEEIKDSAFQHN